MVAKLDEESFEDFANRITSMDIAFDNDMRNVDIHNDGYIEVDGSISGLTEVALRQPSQPDPTPQITLIPGTQPSV
jgi:hypothetical protein